MVVISKWLSEIIVTLKRKEVSFCWDSQRMLSYSLSLPSSRHQDSLTSIAHPLGQAVYFDVMEDAKTDGGDETRR